MFDKFGQGYLYCGKEDFWSNELAHVGAPTFAQQFSLFVNGTVANHLLILGICNLFA